MHNTRHRNGVLAGLALLLLAQIGLLAFRRSREAPAEPPPFVAVGDTLAALVVEVDGRGRELFGGEDDASPTVFLVFHSGCRQCDLVADAWRAWLAGPHEGVRVYAASREESSSARAYASRHGWDVDVIRVPADGGPGARSLLLRTPWIVVADEAGVVRFQDHGSRLAELDAALATLAGADRGAP